MTSRVLRRPAWERVLSVLAGVTLLGYGLSVPPPTQAGGPILVGGNIGISGAPFTWDTASMPVKYRVDPGPLSKQPGGSVVIVHATGIARVKSMFDNWQNVPTANISYSNVGDILPTGSYTGGPVATVQNFNAVSASCDAGAQSPIIFDADGSIFAGLGFSSGVIGFAGPCTLNSSGHILSGIAALNGRFQDGISQPQLSPEQFDEALTHEFGHFSGLDHSQINVGVLGQPGGACSVTELAGLPLMFPFLHCQSRASAGLPVLAPDDEAWISRLYPVIGALPAGVKTLTSAIYGTISGKVFFSDGVTQAQGVNVIARNVNAPRKTAVSVVSGYLYTGDRGQSVTIPVNPGSRFGSRDPQRAGAFDIPVPAGQYTLEVESIRSGFTGGSSVGPLDPPIPVPGNTPPGPVGPSFAVIAGSVSTVNITLLGTPPRFDAFESAALWRLEPMPLWLREDSDWADGDAA